jgi:hypothetical protein
MFYRSCSSDIHIVSSRLISLSTFSVYQLCSLIYLYVSLLYKHNIYYQYSYLLPKIYLYVCTPGESFRLSVFSSIFSVIYIGIMVNTILHMLFCLSASQLNAFVVFFYNLLTKPFGFDDIKIIKS